MERTKGLTQIGYDRLLSRLAEVIHTQRRFITIISSEQISPVAIRYKVKRKGAYYPYLIEQVFTSAGYIYLNLGLVI